MKGKCFKINKLTNDLCSTRVLDLTFSSEDFEWLS